jgi:ABC-2 type transport system permease protein
VIGRVATLVAKTQLTRGRLITLVAIGGFDVFLGLAIGLGNSTQQTTDTLEIVTESYGLQLLAPVVALVLASAALGDFVDDRTLVYLWLRPVPRWQISTGAALASVGTALPLVAVPITLGAYLGSADATVAFGALAASIVATLGYAGVFLALGFKVRRALVWGLAYILIWEGFLARSVSFCAKLSVSVYARSLLEHIAEGELPNHASTTTAAIIWPAVVAVLAVVVTARWLQTTEVA